ncbi:hypothetical protein PG987_006082 [Apiospora arundinis]
MRVLPTSRRLGVGLYSPFIALLYLTTRTAAAAPPAVSDFDWTTLSPSTSLNYTSCYHQTFKCAKLVLPLDWLSADSLLDNEKDTAPVVTLAVIARPATVPESDPRHGGTIITNPGGPSGPGVNFMLRDSELLQRTVDINDDKNGSGGRHYEILSFDPRGVGLTEPSADCYSGDRFARGSAWWADRGLGAVGEMGQDGGRGDLDTVRRAMARAEGFGKLCEAKNAAAGKDGGIWGFMSTSSVARDMVAIVDKLDELRKENAERSNATSGAGNDTSAILRLESSFGGFSYGSALGNYFASMFPGRVGRIILEGVENVDNYHALSWSVNQVDTQHVVEHFWETCFRGRDACALYQSTDKDSSTIRDRVNHFMDALEAKPVSYVSQETNTYVDITRHDVIEAIMNPLYEPLTDFPDLAQLLSEAMQGNMTHLYKSAYRAPNQKDSCNTNKTDPPAYTCSPDAMRAIACGDGESQTNMTAEEFADYVTDLQEKQNADFAFLEAKIRLACTGWRIRPKYRFDGPWTTPAADTKLVQGKPAAPILFMSSRYDPVTPLANALAMSRQHPGSRVLVQESAGHGSVDSPSRCREDYIKRYFATGEMPPEGKMCQPDCQPFQECARLSEGGGLARRGDAMNVRGWRAPQVVL